MARPNPPEKRTAPLGNGQPPSGKRKPPPGTRARIKTLDIFIVILGIVGIIGFNRLSIARLQRSLPNANNLIVGEWKSTRGPEHLVFRADKTIGLIALLAPTQSHAAPASQMPDAAPATQAPNPAPAVAEIPNAAPAQAEAVPAAPPVEGKYQLSEGGKVYVQLSNGKKYTTMIQPQNKNRFDLIDSDTDGVTTFERMP